MCLPFSACRSLSTSPPALWHSENIGFLTCARLWRTAAVRLRGVPFSSRPHRVPGSPVSLPRREARESRKADLRRSSRSSIKRSIVYSGLVQARRRPDGPADRPQTTAGRDTGGPITSVTRFARRAPGVGACTHRKSVVASQESRSVQPIQLVCESCVIQIVPVRRDGTNTIDSCRKSRLCTRTVNGAGFPAWLRSHATARPATPSQRTRTSRRHRENGEADATEDDRVVADTDKYSRRSVSGFSSRQLFAMTPIFIDAF
mgnify:CR=1 FL=1